MSKHPEHQLAPLFEQWAQEPLRHITPLPPSGSDRQYFRLTGAHKSAIGAFNSAQKENLAFIEFTKHFHRYHLPTPAIYAEALDQHIYLLQDLGDVTLFSYLIQIRPKGGIFPAELMQLYKRVITQLPRFQIVAGADLNYAVCYPRASFDRQSMLWDLNYFKYYFLKLAKIPFDEQLLESDFQTFTDFLLQTDCNFFLYRDFQSRNIMLYQNEPYFIDYQGGRRGALHYDLASFLYDAKADVPPDVRTELCEYYLDVVNQYRPTPRAEFLHYFYGYALIRMMQAMGAYGFRGFYERKAHFLESIPYALKSLQWILEHVTLPVALPSLMDVLRQLVNSETLQNLSQTSPTLHVRINSFSYKRGIPTDEAGHGGGYVFDGRGLPNPGRYEQYAHVTGKDPSVIEFLVKESSVAEFLQHVYALVDLTIDDYLHRRRTHLMVNFGCTGGQHRSVYCAEQLAQHVRAKYALKITLHHLEQE
jgi:aminoglycoside/choline kinase family phosphotransferase